MTSKIEKTEWGGWPNCYRMTNGEVELIVTSDIGPRIMRYGFVGGQNLLKVYDAQSGQSGESKWQLRGGHRLWVAPEDWVQTYAPDNVPAEIAIDGEVLTATSPIEPSTGLRKQISVRLAGTGTDVEVVHRLQNTLPFAIRIAVWAVTMFPEHCIGITGFPPRRPHAEVLAPSNPLIMWAFTDLRDPRWTFLEKYLVLRQDPAQKAHTKLGHFNRDTWGACLLNNELFFKRYSATSPGLYPDMGCSFEAFTCSAMLELETLGPITTVEPGQWLEHVENWALYRKIDVQTLTDESLDAVLFPILKG